jgi:hypothetical protein
MKKLLPLLATVVLATGALSADEARIVKGAYGTCYHNTRRVEDRVDGPTLYPVMKEAGFSFVRSDVDWMNMFAEKGKENPATAQVVRDVYNAGMQFLPIIQYNCPGYAKPFMQHLDLYKEFLQTCLKRFGKEVRYWEVVNEPNFDSPWNPKAADYPKMLEITYKEIKAFNPDAKVLYAGLAGVDTKWPEETFKLGAHKYFDIMNCHPYSRYPEDIPTKLKGLYDLMAKYGVADKPMWITEWGYSTVPSAPIYGELLHVALKYIGIAPEECNVAVVSDRQNGYGYFNFDETNIPGFKSVKGITLEDLRTINPDEYQILIPVAHERCPAAYMDDLVRYVRDGGTMVCPSGLPLYFELTFDGKGNSVETQVNDKWMKAFHVGWDSWWTKKGIVPYEEKWQRPAEMFANDITDWDINDHNRAGRMLNDTNLKKGDRFIPLIQGGTDTYTGTIAALYDLNSDMKGNVIVMTNRNSLGQSQITQAQFVPRAFILSFNAGVERVFWYCFRNNNAKKYDSESSFGLLNQDKSPKPAFAAMKTITTMLPEESTVPAVTSKDNVYVANWTRPDGSHVWALWSAYEQSSGVTMTVNIDGEVTSALDYMGKACAAPASGSTITVTGSVLYLVGPSNVTLSK